MNIPERETHTLDTRLHHVRWPARASGTARNILSERTPREPVANRKYLRKIV